MPTIAPADHVELARAYIAAHGDMPSPADCPAAARIAAAVERMTSTELEETFKQFRATVASLPGGWLLLEYGRSLH